MDSIGSGLKQQIMLRMDYGLETWRKCWIKQKSKATISFDFRTATKCLTKDLEQTELIIIKIQI
ncbi:hypothetical protein D3C80_1183530 [compost metagenome]